MCGSSHLAQKHVA